LRAKVAEGYDRSNDYAGVPRQLLAVMANGSRVELLKRISRPTLVIHGTEDPLTPPECGRDTARYISGAKLMMVEGMGHDLPRPLIGRLVEAVSEHCRSADEAVHAS
jgi:pimeloyl-ACP methyl ester carboxylesterase